MKNLFIFRRDLRIYDNNAFTNCINQSNEVIPIFIFTPEQVSNKNTFRSDNAIQFMVESLIDLNTQLNNKLNIFYGDYNKIIKDIIKKEKIDFIYFNLDYTPYSKKRDNTIQNIHKVITFEDLLVSGSIQSVKTGSDGIYTKFTPFYKKALQLPVADIIELGNHWNSKIKKIKSNYSIDKAKELYTENKLIAQNGGRNNAISILKNIHSFQNYNKTRDIPSLNTTMLSAHMKFGTIGIREVYHTFVDKLGKNNGLIQQLYWRDFWMYILWYFPEFYSRPEFKLIKWENNKNNFKKWCLGITGCPIVDAGMRQMNTTGFMHNRVRMIVASYLVFYLGIDWLWGMKYFSQKLVDSDWSNNQGNWQWVAGTEKWSQDYFRAMSMESQTKRFDPDGVYIKTWVPELNNKTPKELIYWDGKEYNGYPKAIVNDMKITRKNGIQKYQDAIKKYKN